jgi:hypothetical protein
MGHIYYITSASREILWVNVYTFAAKVLGDHILVHVQQRVNATLRGGLHDVFNLADVFRTELSLCWLRSWPHGACKHNKTRALLQREHTFDHLSNRTESDDIESKRLQVVKILICKRYFTVPNFGLRNPRGSFHHGIDAVKENLSAVNVDERPLPACFLPQAHAIRDRQSNLQYNK